MSAWGAIPAGGETVVLAAGADERYAMGLAVALTSALRHLDPARAVHVFLFDGGLSPKSRERCRRCLLRVRPDADITVIEDEPDRFAGLHVHGYSRAIYLRLLIPEIVPAEHRRVLYLDSDLVVEADVARLWSLPNEGNAFWAAFDEGVRGTSYVEDKLGFAGVPARMPYFNSGVLLIDLARWREQRISERAHAVLARYSDRLAEPDQDALNIVARGEWSALPPAWNTQVVGLQAWSAPGRDREETVGITHFINVKPWEPRVECLRQAVFERALRASGWLSPPAYWRHLAERRAFAARQWLRQAPPLQPVLKIRRRLRRRWQRAFQGGG